MPFRVDYNSAAADSPLFYHWELRTPKAVCAETDQHGQAVITLADYAWDTYLIVNDTNRHYFSEFALTKQVIRNGGTVEQWNQVPPKTWGEGYPKIELQLRPLNAPNPQGGATGRQPFSSETDSRSAAAAFRRSP